MKNILKKLNKLKKIIIPCILILIIVAGYFMFLDSDSAREAKAGYLRMTETTDYVQVQTSTYGLKVWKNDTDYFDEIYDENGVAITERDVFSGLVFSVGGSQYQASFDTDRKTRVVERNKDRIVLKMSGKIDSAYDSAENFLNDGTNDVTYELYYYIYRDYFIYDVKLNTYEGFYVGNSYTLNRFYEINQREYYFDSGETYAGTTTGEKLIANYSIVTSHDYGAVLATSTPDIQLLKLRESHSGTSTFAFGCSTEVNGQSVTAKLNSGSVKGVVEATLAIRPRKSTSASDRLAWAQQMLAMDTSVFSVGSITNDLNDEIYESYTPDGTMHVTADNNKAEFTLHANATNTWAVLSATSTAGAQSLNIASDQGLEDSDGVSTDWAYLGRRLPYGSMDVNDPDVLFYWDMNSTTTDQAPNKGVGPIETSTNSATPPAVAGNGVNFNTDGFFDQIFISNKNVNVNKGKISFWYSPNSGNTPSGNKYFFRFDDDTLSGSNGQLFARRTPGNTIYFAWEAPGDSQRISYYLPMATSSWYHFAFEWSTDNGMAMYIDGKEVAKNSTYTTPFQRDGLYRKLVIGCSRLTAQIDGTMDEFYISSDPDQSDAPSYYDVVKYTDISAGSMTGIPETGIGSIKWNHPIDSPIWQTQRVDPVFTVHDWSPKTRSTSTGEIVDHLVLDLPLDGTGINANVGKVYDEVSGSWIGTSSSGITFKHSLQGNAASFPIGSIGAVSDTLLIGQGEDFIDSKGMIEFDYKYNGNGTYYGRFFSAGTNYFELRRGNSGLSFSIDYIDANFTPSIDIDDNDWHHFRVSWDDDSNLRQVYIDNTLELSTSTAFTIPSDDHLNKFGIGCEYTGTYFNDGDYDNFKIYNDVILPYGAYYTGEPNDGYYANAHPDLIDYWDGSSGVTQIATKTVTVSNCTLGAATGADGTVNTATEISNSSGYAEFNVDVGTEGSVSLWLKPDYDFIDGTLYVVAGYWDSAIDHFEIAKGDDDYLHFWVGGEHISSEELGWPANTWHHIRAAWKRIDGSNDYLELFVDGESVAVTNSGSINSGFNLTTFRIGNTGNYGNPDAVFDELYLTDSADTPEILTAFGKPLLVPQIAIDENGNNNLKTIETDYDIAPLNEIGTYLVTYHGTLTSDTTFLITETLNTSQSASADIPLDRVHPLISTTYTSDYATITVQRGSGSYSDDFKLVFSEADAGVSSCFIGQGTSGSWGTDLCSATNLLSEVDQNSIIQTDQTGVLNLIQSSGVEAIVRNVVVLSSEATTTEEWHIFADGSVVIDRQYEKMNGNGESRAVNSNFTNYAYYPTTPAVDRGAGVYHDSLYIHLTDINTDRQNDYLSSVKGASSSIAGLNADLYADQDADSYAEGYGAYTVGANYMADPSIPQCEGVCGQPIYHTIGTTTATVNVTTSQVETISPGLFLVKFSGSPDLSGIHKRDKFLDGAPSPKHWNIISVDDDNDQIIMGDQEGNLSTPSALNISQATVGPWFNSLASWEAAEDRDLTSTARYPNGEIEMVECWPMKEVSDTTISVGGWTTAKNNYIKIYTPAAQRHKGKWSDDYYRISFSASGDYVRGIYISEDFVRIDGLQLELINNDYDFCSLFYSANINPESEIFIGSNILQGVLTTSNNDISYGISLPDSDGRSFIANNIIYDFDLFPQAGVYAYGIQTYGESYQYNNTLYNCTIGFRSVGGYSVLKNNLVTNSSHAPYYDNSFPVFGTDYNATDVGTRILDEGNNNRINQTFSFVSASTKDFHLLPSDTGAKGYGETISKFPNFPISLSHDIDGQPRAGNWSIGADQVVEKRLNKFKVVMDPSTRSGQVQAQTLYSPRFLINDFYPQSGKKGSEEDFVTYHNDMSSVVDFHTDKISSLTNDVVGSPYVVDGYMGRGIRLTGSGEYIIASSSLINPNKGTVSFWFSPNWDAAINTGGDVLWRFQSGSSNGYTLRFDDSNDRMMFTMAVDGVAYYIRTENVDSYMKSGTWHNVQAIWDLDRDFATISIDGKINQTETVVEEFQGTPSINYIGYDLVRDMDGVIGDVKFYSEAIVPYGAYYTGYEQNGNYRYANPNLVFYWDAESDKALVGRNLLPKDMSFDSQASMTEEDNIYGNRSLKFKGSSWSPSSVSLDSSLDYSKGCIAFWVKTSDITEGPDFARIYLDNSNSFNIRYVTGGSDIQINYLGDGNYSYIGMDSMENNVWYHIKACWDNDEGIFWGYKNGIKYSQTINTQWNVSNTPSVRIGSFDGSTHSADAYIDQIFVTNNPYAEEIPTAFGRPINIPLMKVNNIRQRLGYDYFVSWTPDPSSVILQYFKNSNESTVFEIGASEGEAQIRRLKGGVRLEGGVRF